jgi:hypothetical protein
MQFNCPTANGNTAVNGPSPDPSAAGTMSACGVANLGMNLQVVRHISQVVRVRVINAPPPNPAPAPDPPWAGDCDTPPDPDGSWVVSDLWVPSASDAGSPLIIYAWLLASDGMGGTTVLDSGNLAFNGGGPNAQDCGGDCGIISTGPPSNF